jgi:transketolase
MKNNDSIDGELNKLIPEFMYWEKTKDIIDQLIDVVLNYRQSGHPGGSRSKAHAFLATLLSGVMRWDIRQPEKKFGDRFVLLAGHTIPLIYCTLAVLNEAMRLKYSQTGDPRYLVNNADKRALYWNDLLNFRHNGGLSGHAEMEGKSLFLKFNTGPTGHGAPAAAGEALALKRAGAGQVRVFALEGETGLTAGSAHETMNSAWGLALDNLFFLVDWNNFGIDEHPVDATLYGTPVDWFAPHGWRVFGAEQGSDWEQVTRALLHMVNDENETKAPGVTWFKTRKGRGYLKYDNSSHGSPHAMNSALFWQTKEPFVEKYGAKFVNYGNPAPTDATLLKDEFSDNLQAVMDVLRGDPVLIDYLANTLVELGDSVPTEISTFCLGKQGNPFEDERIYDFRNYPQDLYAKPGSSMANRMALNKWAAWINSFGASEYKRPLFIACSADLAESTNISGFAKPYGDFKGYGWYERYGSEDGVLLPQEITEFTNAGMMVGLATVNFSEHPEEIFDGFWGASSTYEAFSYLKYGPMRLFSQLAQDCDLKVGKFLFIAGHSGPETADDSRTHFGILEPGVMQLFPEGQAINLHPWEYNEVPVVLGAALRQKAPIIILHLTRPSIAIPDRQQLGIPSHFEAAHGAYVVRDYTHNTPRSGAIIVQGTSAMVNILKILPELEARHLNVKIICAVSSQLFKLQSAEYQHSVLSPADRLYSTVITTQARWLMHDWLFTPLAEEYVLSADWDNRWRTGGNIEEVLDEAHLSPQWILEGIERFVHDRTSRLAQMKSELDALEE